MDTALPLIFTALMALAMLLYVVLDGYDLGVGILLRGVPDAQKDRMIASIGPFWDANETWLVLGVGLLLVAFPLAHGVILGALYLPVAAMLIGLILRGVAFDFRVKARAAHKPLWNGAFWSGSLLAAFSQGYMIGSYVLGFRDDAVGLGFSVLIGRRRTAPARAALGLREPLAHGSWNRRGFGGDAVGQPSHLREVVCTAAAAVPVADPGADRPGFRHNRGRDPAPAQGRNNPRLGALRRCDVPVRAGLRGTRLQPVPLPRDRPHHAVGGSGRTGFAEDHAGRCRHHATDDPCLLGLRLPGVLGPQ